MACVVTTAKEFKQLQEEFNVHPTILELYIKQYLDETGLEEYNPENKGFKRFLAEKFKTDSFIVSDGIYQAMIDKREDLYSDTTYKTKKEAQKAYNEAVSFFTKDNVTIFKTSDNRWKVNISTPINSNSYGNGREQSENLSKRISQEESRTGSTGGSILEDFSKFVEGRSNQTNTEKSQNQQDENQAIENYAKQKGYWIEDLDNSLSNQYGEPIAEGGEALVYTDGESVIKTLSADYYEGETSAIFARIILHNSLFKDFSPLQVIGIGKDSSGKTRVVVKQPFIKGRNASNKEIDAYMHSLGFTSTGVMQYTLGLFTIADLKPENVIVTPEGNIAVIDALYGYESVENEEPVTFTDTAVALESVSQETVSFFDGMDDLSEEDLASMQEEFGSQRVQIDTEESKQPTEEEKSQQEVIDAKNLTATQKKTLSDKIMLLTSTVITSLKNKVEANQNLFGDTYAGIDFTKLSRDRIIEIIGVDNLFAVVKEHYFNPWSEYNPNTLFYAEHPEAAEALQFVYDHWNEFKLNGYGKFINLEGWSVVLGNRDVATEATTSEIEEENESEALEEKETEHYQINYRQISAISSLSRAIRRSFEELEVLDSEGNNTYDEFGFTKTVNSDEAISRILDWTQGTYSIEDFEKALQEKAKAYPWVNAILEQIKEEPYRSLFFNNFRKDFTNYGTSSMITNKKTGEKERGTFIINTRSAVNTFKNKVADLFRKGAVASLIKGADSVTGKGKVNVAGVTQLKNDATAIKNALVRAYNQRDARVLSRAIADNITNIQTFLQHAGITVNTDTLANAFITHSLPRQLEYLKAHKALTEFISGMEALLKAKDVEALNPMEDSTFKYNVDAIVKTFAKDLPDMLEASTYEGDKMYYSYTVPSYVQKMVGKMRADTTTVNGQDQTWEEWADAEYSYSKFFKDENGWNNLWLAMMNRNKDLRHSIDHKSELNYDGTVYTDLTELAYASSLMAEYFAFDGTKNQDYAWYRLPMMANKPSSEFIKFRRFTGTSYKTKVMKGFRMAVTQEIIRMKSVLENATDDSSVKIKNFDISKKDRERYSKVIDKVRNGEPLEFSDLVKNGKLIFQKSGARFHFLQCLNNELINKTELGQMILDKINNVDPQKFNEARFRELIEASINNYMNAMVKEATEYYANIGLFENDGLGNYKRLPFKISPISTYIRARGINVKKMDKNSPEYRQAIAPAVRDQKLDIMTKVEEYLWNDKLATINIIQLTTTDLAYYKDTEDFQKRFAQVHAPTMKLNKTAKMKDGTRYSDGKIRAVVLKDEEVKSEILANVEEVFDSLIANATTESEKSRLKELKKSVSEGFEKINVADAQGYSCPTSYRKKLAMQGKWDEHMEEAYQRIRNGNTNVADLELLCQPLKPFVYSTMRKDRSSSSMVAARVPLQIKDSEYMLLMAEALTRGKKSKLNAIFDVMEESHYDGKTYRQDGIDTAVLESGVKVGLASTIDLTGDISYEEAKARLENAIYMKPDKSSVQVGDSIDRYNSAVVDTFDSDDYGIQQEVPAHLQDHEQLFGSQMRILTMTDFNPSDEIKVGNDTKKISEIRDEYFKLIADNINESLDKLREEFGEGLSPIEQNRKLSKLLQQAILNDQKYGVDMLKAVEIRDGKFTIPLDDPIQAMRIQQLLNSIVKSRINKQKIAGGPVVQTSVFGMSDDLSIVFKDKDGQPLMTLAEFAKSKGLEKSKSESEYKKYISGKQHSVAYFECYITCPNSELEKVLTKADGTLMTPEEAIKEGLIDDSARQLIGYRIPTEDKYSMAPLRIKGFLPRAAGEACMLPKEITLLSGSDFDIDKIYTMAKALFKSSKMNKKKLVDDILSNKELLESVPETKGKKKKELRDMLNIIADEIENGKIAFSEDTLDMAVYDYYADHKQEYTDIKFKEATKDARDKRNNRLFDLQMAVLTAPQTMDKMFNPGSFDVQKKTSRIIRVLQETSGHTYAELQGKSIDELNEILASSTQSKDMTDPRTQVYFHKQNMTAGKLIGIFANNNTAHGFMSMQKASLNLKKNETFSFNGRTISSGTRIDEVKAQDGSYISKNIASFLAASVDAVKDPVLNFMNLNTFTTGVAMTLARLGFDSDSIGLLLTQPSIIEATTEYFNKSNDEGYVDAMKVINDKLGVESTRQYDKSLARTMFTKDELAANIKGQDKEFQKRALMLFGRVYTIAQDLQEATFLTKFNSVTNAAGPSIGDNIVTQQRVDKFISRVNKGSSKITFDKHIFSANALLNAFYNSVYGEKGALNTVFRNFYMNSEGFREVVDTFTGSIDSKLNADDINNIFNEWMLYKFTSKFLDGSIEAREKFIKEFPNELEKRKTEIPGNTFLNSLVVESASPKVPVPVIKLETGKMTMDNKEVLMNAWTELFKNPETRQLAEDLVKYNLYRQGMKFSPTTFINLFSTEGKLLFNDYIKAIEDTSSVGDVNEFFLQYCLNHSDNRKFVKDITDTTKPTIDGNKLILSGTDAANVGDEIQGEIILPEVITHNGVPYLLSIEKSTYTKAPVLGNRYNFLEYDCNTTAADMKSVLNINPEGTEKHEGKSGEEAPSKPDNSGIYHLTETDQALILSNWSREYISEAWAEVRGSEERNEKNFNATIESLLRDKLKDENLADIERNKMQELLDKLC